MSNAKMLYYLQEKGRAIVIKVQPMSQQAVSEAGKAFLKQVAEILAGVGNEAAEALNLNAQQMTALESELRSAIGAWRHTEDVPGRV